VTRWQSIDPLASNLPAAVVSIGNFDGVHLGHQAILRKLVDEALGRKLDSVAVTFNPHPSVILGRSSPPLLTTPELRGDFIEMLGVNHFVIQPFDSGLAKICARDFVEFFLVQKLRARCLVVGPNAHVGRGREGTPEKLKQLAQEFGFDLRVVPFVQLGGEEVSSTRIRSLISIGDVNQAIPLLGRPFRTAGSVIRGAGRGRSLGFPTANLGPVSTVLPKTGVYATVVTVNSRGYVAATNIGHRPTFGADQGSIVESHLLSFSGEMEGKPILIDWIARIRDEKKFSSANDLQRQIRSDLEVVEKTAKKKKLLSREPKYTL